MPAYAKREQAVQLECRNAPRTWQGSREGEGDFGRLQAALLLDLQAAQSPSLGCLLTGSFAGTASAAVQRMQRLLLGGVQRAAPLWPAAEHASALARSTALQLQEGRQCGLCWWWWSLQQCSFTTPVPPPSQPDRQGQSLACSSSWRTDERSLAEAFRAGQTLHSPCC